MSRIAAGSAAKMGPPFPGRASRLDARRHGRDPRCVRAFDRLSAAEVPRPHAPEAPRPVRHRRPGRPRRPENRNVPTRRPMVVNPRRRAGRTQKGLNRPHLKADERRGGGCLRGHGNGPWHGSLSQPCRPPWGDPRLARVLTKSAPFRQSKGRDAPGVKTGGTTCRVINVLHPGQVRQSRGASRPQPVPVFSASGPCSFPRSRSCARKERAACLRLLLRTRTPVFTPEARSAGGHRGEVRQAMQRSRAYRKSILLRAWARFAGADIRTRWPPRVTIEGRVDQPSGRRAGFLRSDKADNPSGPGA